MDIGTYNDIPDYFFEESIHSADFYEIVYFKKGNGYLELDKKQIRIRNHVIIFISPLQKRRWFVDKLTIDCYFLIFQENFLSKFFADKLFTYRLQYFFNNSDPLSINIDKYNQLHFQNVLDNLLMEVKSFRSDSEHIIRSLLYYLLIKLNRDFSEKYGLSPETQRSNIPFLFKKLLLQQISKQRNVDYYAKKMAISRVTLNKYIKEHFGVTVSDMINGYLLSEIKVSLLYTTLSIKEIADLYNYSEPNHLSRFFKSSTGYTPKQYRLTYQNGTSLY